MMVNNKFIRAMAGAMPLAWALAAGNSVFAQESDAQSGLEYGLFSELRYDDNIFLSESREVDSFILEARPFVRGTLYNRGNTYQLEYQLTHAQYFDSSDDNYDDHELTGTINHRFTHRHAIGLEASYAALTEERGTGFSEEPNLLVTGPDDYSRALIDFVYFLGVPSADLRFEFGAKHREMEFDSSFVGDSRDYDEDVLSALARYRLGARTDLLFEYRKQFIDYVNTPRDFTGQALALDAEEDYYLAGLAWEFTGKTSGEVRVGHSTRDYDDTNFENSGFHWEVELEWRPRNYSRFTLNTGRMSQETYGSGLFINTRKYELAWNHAWADRLSSEIRGGIMDDEYESSVRDDDRMYWRAQLEYEYADWLQFALGYRYWENDSTFELVNYEQNVLFLNAKIEL